MVYIVHPIGTCIHVPLSEHAISQTLATFTQRRIWSRQSITHLDATKQDNASQVKDYGPRRPLTVAKTKHAQKVVHI